MSDFQKLTEIPSATLASLALRFLKEPMRSTEGPRLDGMNQSEEGALRLLQKRLRISDGALVGSVDAQRKMLAELSRLLAAAHALPPDREREAVARLGKRGLLRLSDYQLEFAAEWTRFEASVKERRALVSKMFSSGQVSYRHLMRDKRDVDFPSVSLVAKRIEPRRGQPFVMLAVAERLSSVLRVHSAWRIPMEFVPPVVDLWNLLERLVGSCGAFFKIEGRPARQLVHYDTVTVEGNRWRTLSPDTFPFQLKRPADGPIVGTAIYRRGASPGELDVSVAFAIKVQPYQEMMREMKS